MKRCACLLLLLLCLLLTACAPEPIPEPVPAAPAEAAAEVLPEPAPEPAAEAAEPAPEIEPEPEPVPLPEGPEVLLFGVSCPSLLAEDGTVLVEAAQFAAHAPLTCLEREDGVLLCREAALLRFPYAGACALAVRQAGTNWVPLRRAAEQFGFLTGETADGRPYAARPRVPEAPTANVNVPILMYHAVGDEAWGYSDLFVRPADLETQLQYLADNGYETIFFDDLSHLEDFEKPVLLTFDDGYDDNYTELFPILQKYQAKATIFVIPKYIGASHKMTEAQIQELAQSGLVSIQSHTWSHGNLSQMDEQTLIFEMEQSRDYLTALTGQAPFVVCYPEGTRSELSVAVARRYYEYGLLMNGYTWNTSDDPFYVTRMYIPRGQWSIQWNVEKAGTSDPWR